MVVGIRQTKSATSTGDADGLPVPLAARESENGQRRVTSRKTMVSPPAGWSSAISLGVFWRWRLDHGDHAVDEGLAGFAAMRITIQSDRTRVPPVTGEKSPPASRITGPIRR